MENNMEDEN